jgi:hypothetical protein
MDIIKYSLAPVEYASEDSVNFRLGITVEDLLRVYRENVILAGKQREVGKEIKIYAELG